MARVRSIAVLGALGLVAVVVAPQTPASASASFVITTYAGIGNTASSTGDGGQATSATLNQPAQIAMDSAGSIYVAEYMGNRVRKIAPNGVISTIAGNGTGSSTGDGGLATSATVWRPWGVSLDNAGNIYTSEDAGARVRKINTSGYISTVAGTGTTGFFGDGGQATSAQLNNPNAVVLDAAGSMYIPDYSNNRVRKVDNSGVITTVVGTGSPGSTGDGGAATSATINGPSQLAFDSTGNMWISEYTSCKVRKVDLSNVITTVAGTGTCGYSGDGGVASAAQIGHIEGITFDSAGSYYLSISSGGGRFIRKVDAGGTISTVVGTGTASFSGDGGAATSATVDAPTGMVISTAGDFYFSDYSTHTIRKVALLAPASGSVTVSAVVDPSLTFTVVGRSSVCNGQSATNFQTGATGTAVSLGHVTAATVGGGAQDLSVGTNAANGFAVYLRTSGTTPDSLRDGSGHSIADVSGTNASPGSAPVAGTAGFGYTTSDSSTAFTSNTWAKLTNVNASVLVGTPGTAAKSACLGYEVAVAPLTPAGSYTSNVIYTAVPSF